MKHLLFSLLLSFLLPSSFLFSQCNHQMNEGEYNDYLHHIENYFKLESNRLKRVSGQLQMVPLKINVVTKSDGDGGQDVNEIAKSIIDLNQQFISIGVQFYICGNIKYINNTTYYNYDNSNTASILPDTYNEEGKINVFYCNEIKLSGFGNAGGFAYFPGGPLRIYLSSTNSSVIIHEMGHFYGLPHTFEKSDSKNPDFKELVTRGSGSNCSTAGDGICDTPADPYIHKTSQGYFQDCIYTGSSLDANGDKYEPMIDNFMSYYSGCDKEYFTQGQFDVMQSYTVSASRNSWITSCSSVAAPSNLTGIYDPNQGLKLSWKDNSTNEEGFVLEYKETGWTYFKQSLFYSKNTISGLYGELQANTNYTFRIRPINSPDAYSNEFLFTSNKDVYCFPYHTEGCSSIWSDGSVSLYTIKKVSVDSENGGFENETACGENGYSYYSNTPIRAYKELYYTIKVDREFNEEGSLSSSQINVWIDLNENGSFEENELLEEYDSDWGSSLFSLHLDPSVTPGTKKLRIKLSNNYSTVAQDPCATISYGETEDYLINIIDLPKTQSVNLSATYVAPYSGKLTFSTISDPVNTKYTIHRVDADNITSVLDTVILSEGSIEILHETNGLYKYYLKKLDGTIASSIIDLNVNKIEYCASYSSDGCQTEKGKAIEKIRFMGETSFEETTTCVPNGYRKLTSAAPNVYTNLEYKIEVTQAISSNFYPVKITLWIDFNDDKIFDNQNEVFIFNYTNNQIYIASFSIPETSSLGIKNARISLNNWSPNSPCDVLPGIDVKDFTINIIKPAINLPVTIQASQTGKYSSKITWSNSVLTSNTEYQLFRVTSQTKEVLIKTFTKSSIESAEDIILNGSNHSYYVKTKSDNKLVSNVVILKVSNYTLPFTLVANQVNQLIRLSWNLNSEYTEEKVSVARTSFASESSAFNHHDSVRTRLGIYDDYRITTTNTGTYYVLKSSEGTEVSNRVLSSVKNNYCKPSFVDLNCMQGFSYSVSKFILDSSGDYSDFHLKSSPYCFSNNRFTESEFSYYNQIDTIAKTTDSLSFMAFVSMEYNCTSNISTKSRNLKLWVDFNENGVFEDIEIVFANAPNSFLCGHNFSISMPSTYNSGYKRTRLIVTDNNEKISNPCGTYQTGTGFDQIFYFEGTPVALSLDEGNQSVYETISIFPNPTRDGKFTIQSEGSIKEVSIRNMLGSELYVGDEKNIPSLISGMYLINIQLLEDPNKWVQKIIVVQ